MNSYIQKATFLSMFFLSLISSTANAQENKEYLAEIGLQVGGNIYAGDVNTIARKSNFIDNTSNIQPDLGIFFRYKFNPRIAIRLGYDFTSVKGDYVYSNTSADTYNVTLNNSKIGAIDFWGEYNFFDYEKNKYKRYSKTYSPYIFAGMGYMMMPEGKTETTKAVTLPFGFGVKVKLATRWNLNLQWTNCLLFSDNLEGLPEYDNPSPQTKANLLNNDLLSGLNIGLSFDFWEKPCDCNNGGYKATKSPKTRKPINNSRSKSK